MGTEDIYKPFPAGMIKNINVVSLRSSNKKK